MIFLKQPASIDRLGDHLKINLLSGDWTEFRAAIAFVKRSGTRHIVHELYEFSQENRVEIVTGIDHQGTTAEGLQDLLGAVSSNGRVLVFHNHVPSTFHPKVYLFKSPDVAELLIGSGNLTEGGLFTNYEAGIRLNLDLNDPDENSILESVETTLDTWMNTKSGTALILDTDLLDLLIEIGLVPSEEPAVKEIGETMSSALAEDQGSGSVRHSPFVALPVSRAPPTSRRKSTNESIPKKIYTPVGNQISGEMTHFVMTLQRTDVGVGQTQKGTSRRSPEIFIPLSARDMVPDFWEWPNGFTLDPNNPGKRDRKSVRMRLGTNIVNVNMMTWPAKHDFRLRCEALRSAGSVDDIIHLEKVDSVIGVDYFAEIVPQGTISFPTFLSRCDQSVRNSKKKYGYY